MAERRRYDQFCGVARALDVVGERWTLLIARDLLLGPRRFADLQAGLPGLTPTLLTRRLRHLEAEQLVRRRRLPAPAAATVYELTPRGRELEPVVLALGRFGAPLLTAGPNAADRLDVRWAVLSLKRRYRDRGHRHRLELRIGDRTFAVRMAEHLHAADGADPDADAVVSGPVAAWFPWFGAGDSSGLDVRGNPEALAGLTASLASLEGADAPDAP
jgi:DNA-binding HxlR family transcriptional regulator